MTDPAASVTPAEIAEMADTGRILPGDCVCVRNGERGLLNWAIRRVQARALADLDPGATPEQVTDAAAYTHIACCLGAAGVGELYYPRARRRAWAQLVGSTVLIRRPPGTVAQLTQASAECYEDVLHQVPYATAELLYYYFRWGRKTTFHHKFAELFRHERYDVCSGSYVRWCARAGIEQFRAEVPEAWYPARLAADCALWTVGKCHIIEAT